MADARHLPLGRSQAGDRHLNFHETRDNLDGRLVGVLDGGGFGPAEPALDHVTAWHLLDETPRAILRRELGCGDVQWRRGMAWAFQQALGLVWYYLYSNPTMSRWRMRSLDRIVSACAA